ncbi:hypothetical protein P7K49_035818 [Saguinus oedipus]|uniref:Uncharacterized protein n=1 Tax=Saguinus oedipus TaxID=9490 RepID=A0ABQ9TPS5_SAGOE|nr:hypothetical protein P7K49_035818 [Saguinus oedipus]
MVTRNANDYCPTVDRGCPCAEKRGRRLGAGCASGGEPGQSPRLYSDGRRDSSPENIRALSFPPQPRFVQTGLQPRGREDEKEEGRSLYLALTRRVPGPRLRFPLRALLPSLPRHPLLRRSVPQSLEEPPPTPQDPAGNQSPPLYQSPPAFYRPMGPIANRKS